VASRPSATWGEIDMRRLLVPFLAVLVLAGAAAGIAAAVGADQNQNKKTFEYAIGLWGDLPYSDLQAQTGVPNLIADMNDQELQFIVHDGDLKAGSGTPGSVTPTTCSPALYQQALGFFNAYRRASIFTPGDNDWTDCDRASNGGYNSLERLDNERQLFFSTDLSQGQHPLQLEVQQTPSCPGFGGGAPGVYTQVRCSENRRWELHNVMYATFNVQGSCNNLCDTNPDPAEEQGRTTADIAWLQQAFAAAKANHDVAVMLISQADPGWDKSDATRGPLRDPKTLVETDGAPDGFHDWLVAVRAATIDFGLPVAYVNGDSHYFRIDKPLQDASGRRVENFTRVETFGDNQGNGNQDVNWLKVLVDPESRDVFAFEPQIVPANQQ